MDTVRIQDDLFNHVNGEWLEKTAIPADRPAVGGFMELRDSVERLLTADLNRLCETGDCADPYMARAISFYALAKDVKRRSAEGFRPVMPLLKKIRNLTGISHFNRNLKELVLADVPLPFTLTVMEDMADSNKYCLYVDSPSILLPDTTYYTPDYAEKHDKLIALFRQTATDVLHYARIPEEEKEQLIEDAIAFDAILATLVKSNEERADYIDDYRLVKTRTVGTMLRPVKLKKLFTELFGTAPEYVSVSDMRFAKSFSTLFNEQNFTLYKHWAYVLTAIKSAEYLSEKLRDKGTLFKRSLRGIAVTPSVERFAYDLTTGFFSGPIGLYYGRTYFGEEAKKDVVDMVKGIIETYKKRVSVNPILCDETKAKAIGKLSTMKIKMGYPDKLNTEDEHVTYEDGVNLYTAQAQIRRALKLYQFSLLYLPVDKSQWGMNGHVVNACYNPFANDITFPAGILQPPFYSIHQSRSANLGGIGAVIGHEISHAFDNNGAQIDENGNLNNWWTKEDFKRFRAITKKMIAQFDGIVLPWGTVNGTLIVSENIADNGGMAVTLEMMHGIDGADYAAYFTNWARVWCQKGTEGFNAMRLAADVHGPNILRANMPPRNFPEWYETFGVTKKDGMFITPSKRIVIW